VDQYARQNTELMGRTIRGNAAGRPWEGRVGEGWGWGDRAENEKHEHTNDFE